MSKADWVWMPHPGHLIISRWCRFHLHTYVNGYIVSTVGEYFPDQDIRRILAPVKMRFHPEKHIDMDLKGDAFDYEWLRVFGFEELGLHRTYETMVFKAKERANDHQCCPWEVFDWSSIDFEGYNESTAAYLGHLAMCEKYDKESKPELIKRENEE